MVLEILGTFYTELKFILPSTSKALLNKHTFCIFVEKQWTVHDVNHQIK